MFNEKQVRKRESQTKIDTHIFIYKTHIGKDLNAGKDRGQEEKGTTEDEMIGGHQRLNGHEFAQTPDVLQSMGSQCVGHNLVTEQQHIYDT